MRIVCLLLVLAAGCSTVEGPMVGALSVSRLEVRGVVVRVLDGDTLDVVVSNGTRRVRLADVDAPEKKQPFGQESRTELERMVGGKDVVVMVSSTDRYGRMVGEVRYGSNRWANAEMVGLGMAWHYREYSKNEALHRMESAARDLRMGLWSQDGCVEPWVYRKGH